MRASWTCATVMLALVATCAADAAHADEYPSRPIRIVVPYAPGGGADTVARIVAKRVGETIGQTIVIENRGGAGSIHRHRAGGQGRARRVHAAARAIRADLDQSRGLQGPAL